MTIIFQTGDPVTIDCQGRTVPGVVQLASSNGKSLMLKFDAMLDGHVGMMPVLLDDDGVFRSIMSGVAVELTAA
jgi:NADH dehydrogenase FAD-containing subunit